MVKVAINRDGCIGCGNCWNLCPDVFEQSSKDGHSEITPKYRLKGNAAEGEIPEKIKCAKAAESACPVQVISVK